MTNHVKGTSSVDLFSKEPASVMKRFSISIFFGAMRVGGN
jgi:hypothetical protein